MSVPENIIKRIDELNKLKENAQKACRLEAAKPPSPTRSEDKKEKDYLDWTNEDWKQKESIVETTSTGGYRNSSELAEATYKKELLKHKVNQEKYESVMTATISTSACNVTLAAEDIDAIAQGLRDASGRRQKRRKVGDGGLYMNDRNRQFNLKLDREFGKSKE